LDHPVDPLNHRGIETESQQLPGAVNLDGQGIKILRQKLPVAPNIGFELLALIAHGAPLRIRREQTRSQSSMAAEIGAMMTLNTATFRIGPRS